MKFSFVQIKLTISSLKLLKSKFIKIQEVKMNNENETKYKKEFVERFWKKVDKRGNGDCWEWTASIQSKGYGCISVEGKIKLAHRVAYEIASDEEVPDGMMVLHRCDNRRCVNPSHLFLGSNQDNVDDMVKKDRQARGEKNGRSKLTFNSCLDKRNTPDLQSG
jgi:hypothetical protein